jgi:predicted lactoylglutathione lyase
MYGVSVISNDGNLFKTLVFPSRYVSEGYLETLAEDFSKLGYPIKFDYRDGKRVLIISDKVVIMGE